MKKKIIVCVFFVMAIVLAVFVAEYCKNQKLLREIKSQEGGYIRMFRLKDYKKNFINLDLKYVGQAKVSIEKTDEFETYLMETCPRFDGDTLYAMDGYHFFATEMSFEIYKDNFFDLYDIDFVPEYEEGKMYVMSIGRELNWLQYNPDWISQFGTVANRVGFKWDKEIVPNTVYVYEFSYDCKQCRYLGEMTMEF